MLFWSAGGQRDPFLTSVLALFLTWEKKKKSYKCCHRALLWTGMNSVSRKEAVPCRAWCWTGGKLEGFSSCRVKKKKGTHWVHLGPRNHSSAWPPGGGGGAGRLYLLCHHLLEEMCLRISPRPLWDFVVVVVVNKVQASSIGTTCPVVLDSQVLL